MFCANGHTFECSESNLELILLSRVFETYSTFPLTWVQYNCPIFPPWRFPHTPTHPAPRRTPKEPASYPSHSTRSHTRTLTRTGHPRPLPLRPFAVPTCSLPRLRFRSCARHCLHVPHCLSPHTTTLPAGSRPRLPAPHRNLSAPSIVLHAPGVIIKGVYSR